MDAADNKRHYQESGHTPECPEQPGILLRVVVRRMRQIPREASVRTAVALLTGGHHIVAAEARPRITNRKNVMCPMAIIALCRLGIAQLRNFAMVRVKVGLGNRLMAATALSHDGELESLFVRTPDGMCAVAVVAHGESLVGFAALCDVNA